MSTMFGFPTMRSVKVGDDALRACMHNKTEFRLQFRLQFRGKELPVAKALQSGKEVVMSQARVPSHLSWAAILAWHVTGRLM